jgi:hypothetical protein
MRLGVSDVRFWHCPVSEHTAVVWEGATARCMECLMTSAHTEELISRGQADQRQRDIQWLRFLAQKVRAAPAGGDILIMDLPLVPANILEKVAGLLAEGPIGPEGG